MSTPEGEKSHPQKENPSDDVALHFFNPRQVFWLSAVVIISTISAGIAYIFLGNNDPLRKYYIMISLVSFGLSSVSSLLFAIKANFQGTVGFFSMTVGGPAALWLIVITVISHLPNSIPQNPKNLKILGELANEVEYNLNWVNYSSWKKKKIGQVESIIKRDEVHHLQEFLVTTYFNGEEEKLSTLQISTLFVYFGKSVVKFQKITGKKDKATVQFPFKAYPTKSGASPTSFLLKNRHRGNNIKNKFIFTNLNDNDSPTNWASVTSNGSVDCLIIAFYENDIYEEGDYLIVDIKKYLDVSSIDKPLFNTKSLVNLGVASYDEGISHFALWEMKNSILTSENSIPLSFKLHSGSPQNNIDEINKEIKTWLELLDRFYEHKKEHHKETKNGCTCTQEKNDQLWHFLQEIHREIKRYNSKGLYKIDTFVELATKADNNYNFNAKNIEYPLIATFEWGIHKQN